RQAFQYDRLPHPSDPLRGRGIKIIPEQDTDRNGIEYYQDRNKITPAATGVKLREAISSGQNLFAFLYLSIPVFCSEVNPTSLFILSVKRIGVGNLVPIVSKKGGEGN
ncbi:MAG: hypothetical protein P8Y37_12830, partial [Anaerolineales bacterium]